jgi:hypothetical protein
MPVNHFQGTISPTTSEEESLKVQSAEKSSTEKTVLGASSCDTEPTEDEAEKEAQINQKLNAVTTKDIEKVINQEIEDIKNSPYVKF